MLIALKQRGLDLIDELGLNAADKEKVLGGTAKEIAEALTMGYDTPR